MPKFYSPIRAQPSIAMARAGQTMSLLTAKILSKPIKPIIKFIREITFSKVSVYSESTSPQYIVQN